MGIDGEKFNADGRLASTKPRFTVWLVDFCLRTLTEQNLDLKLSQTFQFLSAKGLGG